MPVYEYECEKCGSVFEAMQKFSDPPLSACTSCGGQVKKLISRTGFALKGGGWHEQGYGSASPAAAPAACPAAAGGTSGCAGCPKAAGE